MTLVRRFHLMNRVLGTAKPAPARGVEVAVVVVAFLLLTAPCVEASSFFPVEGTGPELVEETLLAKLGAGENDIMIDDMRFRVSDLRKSGFSGTKWTNGIVYYAFDPAVTAANRTAWLDAAANWSAVADLSFVARTTQSNYIYVMNDSGNWSWVGMISGMQEMGIYNWSWEFIIAHEIGHALGLSHEHSRSDRDTYVVIHTANISSTCGPANNESCAYNFDKRATTNYGTYDFDSVMHYARCDFSNAACPPAYTISAQPAYSAFNDAMGQRSHLSSADEAGMAAHYGPAAGSSIFSDGFESGGVGGWSTSVGLGCAGKTCGNYTACNGNSSCSCYTTYSGGGVCSLPFLCPLYSQCPTGVCSAGKVCVVGTCCSSAATVCISPYCGLASNDGPQLLDVETSVSCR